MSQSGELVIEQSGGPRNLDALGSYILKFVSLRPLPLLLQLQSALLKWLCGRVFPQHFEESINNEERVVAPKESGIRDGARLFAAVIKMRSIDELRQSLESVTLCMQSVMEGQQHIGRPLVHCFWLQSLRWSECFDVNVTKVQFEFLECEITASSPIFSL